MLKASPWYELKLALAEVYCSPNSLGNSRVQNHDMTTCGQSYLAWRWDDATESPDALSIELHQKLSTTMERDNRHLQDGQKPPSRWAETCFKMILICFGSGEPPLSTWYSPGTPRRGWSVPRGQQQMRGSSQARRINPQLAGHVVFLSRVVTGHGRLLQARKLRPKSALER